MTASNKHPTVHTVQMKSRVEKLEIAILAKE